VSTLPDQVRREPIPRLGFHAPDDRVPGFEVIELATLHDRMRGRDPGGLHRLDFHTLTLVTEGTGQRMVDFTTYPYGPGTLLWVRPDQVQRFDLAGASNGTHLLFTAAFLPRYGRVERLANHWYGPVRWQLGTGDRYAMVTTLLHQIRAEYARAPDAVSPEILQSLLATLLLQVDRLPLDREPGDPRAGGEIYARFRAELERSYQSTRRAEDYAGRLGYTVKTLTRACLAATGKPTKQVIDERVALEAQRLLAHTDTPVASIGHRLGFTEATNFGKFFARHVGTTPGEFRRVHGGRA
jgi:AraC-like DNA-binding protein